VRRARIPDIPQRSHGLALLLPVAQRLRHVGGCHILCTIQVRHGSCHSHATVHRPGREAHLVRGPLEQANPLKVRATPALHLFYIQARVEYSRPVSLNCHSLRNLLTCCPALIIHRALGQEQISGNRPNHQPHIDTIKQGTGYACAITTNLFCAATALATTVPVVTAGTGVHGGY